MMKKRITRALAVAMLVLTALPITASAHGHHRGNGAQNNSYSICTVENCNTSGIHCHGDTYYAGHYMNDGHAHRTYGRYNGRCYR